MWNFPLEPPKASEYALQHDPLFYTISLLTACFTIVGFAIVIFFAIRYREGSKASRANLSHENLRVEILWSVPPLGLAFLIFLWSTKLYVDNRKPPQDAMEIFVIGKQWMWHVQHANGVRENNELHVPVGVPIKFTMVSQDVIHAFYIPAFRMQYHVVPGRYTVQYATPNLPGKYPLFCTMHCGTQHSEMGGYVTVMPQAEFAKWLANGGSAQVPAKMTMAQMGEKIFKDKGCGNCHGGQDTDQGPTLDGVYGQQRKMASGQTVLADDTYMRESILDPYRLVTSGYRDTMPADYKEYLAEEDVLNLLAYMKTLGGKTSETKTVTRTEGNATMRGTN